MTPEIEASAKTRLTPGLAVQIPHPLGVSLIAAFFLSATPVVGTAMRGPGHGGHAGPGHGSSGGHSAAGSHHVGGHGQGTTVARDKVSRVGSVDLFLATPRTYVPQDFAFRFLRRPRPHFFSTPFFPVYGSGYDSGYEESDSALVNGMYVAPAVPEPSVLSGTVRLDVDPTTAQVFVDGVFVGTANDFYHSLAGLTLEAGVHHLEFQAPGYETLTVVVEIDVGRTIAYRATLRRQ